MSLSFAPTYKYDVGTNIYDTRLIFFCFFFLILLLFQKNSDKNRVPSWTDRVMFKGNGIVGLSYDRIEIDTSDHKPIYLIAICEVKKINTLLYFN